MGIARDLCLAKLHDPNSTLLDYVQSFEYLLRNREFSKYECRCFASTHDELSFEEREAEMAFMFPEVQTLYLNVDEYEEKLRTTPYPYVTEEDRSVDIIAHLLSGYENVAINENAYVETTARLGRMVWSTPQFAKAQPRLDEVDPLLLLQAMRGRLEAASMKTLLRFGRLDEHFAEIQSPHCSCFPGDPRPPRDPKSGAGSGHRARRSIRTLRCST